MNFKFKKLLLILSVLFSAVGISPAKNNLLNFNKPIKSQLQSDDGFIWFLTESDVWRFDGYETLNLRDIYDIENQFIIKELLTLAKGQDGQLWVGTDKKGLLLITDDAVSKVHAAALSNYKHSKIINHNGWMWSVTSKGLIQFNKNKFFIHNFPAGDKDFDDVVVGFKAIKSDLIVVRTNQLISFSVKDKTFKKTEPSLNGIIRDITFFDQYYLSSDSGVYSSQDMINWNSSFDFLEDKKIRSIQKHKDYYWIVTIFDGVYRYGMADHQITHYSKSAPKLNRLSSDFVTGLFFDHSDLVWFNHFNGSVDSFDLKTEHFGLNALSRSPNCQLEESFLSMTETPTEFVISSQSGIHLVDKDKLGCELLNKNSQGKLIFENNVPTSLMYENDLGVLVGSSDGVYQIFNAKPINKVSSEVKFVNFISKVDEIGILVGALNGLYLLDAESFEVTKYFGSESVQFYSHTFNKKDEAIYFATNEGVYFLKDGVVQPHKVINGHLPTSNIYSVHAINNMLFIGTLSDGLYSFNLLNDSIHKYSNKKPLNNIAVKSILSEHNHLWLGSDQGLIKVNIESQSITHYSSDKGLQSENFNLNAAYQTDYGRLFFGGIKGYNFFNDQDLKSNVYKPQINFTQVKRANEIVKINSADSNEFRLEKNLNDLDVLTLDHTDYMMAFEFAAMDFNSPESNLYQYRLHPYESSWNEINSQHRVATYTNLPSGNFELQVQGSNNDGVWSEKPKVLKITVLPPPWLAWWAITSYVLIGLAAIYWYVQRKIKANILAAEILRIEVAEKTKELNVQKQTVESLLAKKNELFSNVSHEFRTPLTLILGPIKELLKKQVDEADIKTLNMVNRNANRLLSLVEQLLQIARVSDFKKIKAKPQNTQKQVQALVESFQHMAKSKKINLQLNFNEQATIEVTDQFIDAVLGNLVSNAIKYTHSWGSVTVLARCTGKSFRLSVKDTGAGLTIEQQKDIFKRFKRLDSHRSIEGIGIGLSVVEELVKINDGLIKVESELGAGSEFTVEVPIVDSIDGGETGSLSTLVNQLQAESLELTPAMAVDDMAIEDSSLNTLLVIEDNHDMREHITSIVKPHFNCLSAESGAKGLATAIEQIPDIIISDVMMPEMDGFKVARVIRADERTSHIPLILLTALNDKTSRIKGWRENVDAYMTKPFDRDELLIQLNNMLTIRDILKNKAGQLVKQGQSSSSALPKRDQQFIDKLIEVIQLNYQDPLLNRAKIASEMAVSERQLQRKVKALIDQNPIDMLREHRLNKAKELLKDGYQVSQVGDECGFNSLSYFSQCFKAQFGLSPKKYQQCT